MSSKTAQLTTAAGIIAVLSSGGAIYVSQDSPPEPGPVYDAPAMCDATWKGIKLSAAMERVKNKNVRKEATDLGYLLKEGLFDPLNCIEILKSEVSE